MREVHQGPGHAAGRRAKGGRVPQTGVVPAVGAPDFRSRKVWTVFAADKCEAAFWGLGLRNGVAALVGEVFEGQTITTDNALQKDPAAHTDGYLVWKTDG
jgi:hypothetical protein